MASESGSFLATTADDPAVVPDASTDDGATAPERSSVQPLVGMTAAAALAQPVATAHAELENHLHQSIGDGHAGVNDIDDDDDDDAPQDQLPASSVSSASCNGGNASMLDEYGDATTLASTADSSHDNNIAICQQISLGENTRALADGDGQGMPATPPEASAPPAHRRSNSHGGETGGTNRKKRLCRFPGCTRVIKSQGHCQRHGAKAKRCKVEGCEKQAQGTHNGMCKRHWRAVHFPHQVAAKAEAERKKQEDEKPPPAVGESVYDTVLPASIAYRPSSISVVAAEKNANHAAAMVLAKANGEASPGGALAAVAANANAAAAKTEGLSGPEATETGASEAGNSNIVSAMPLVTFLRDGALHKPVGWHRQAERRARGMFECPSLGCQLEPWEKQLALVEILLLSGGTPHANFRDLAYAWGRERGFHQAVASSVCTRRGEVERKKRSDAGRRGGAAAGGSSSKASAAGTSAAVPHRKRAKYNTKQQPQQQRQPQPQQLQLQQPRHQYQQQVPQIQLLQQQQQQQPLPPHPTTTPMVLPLQQQQQQPLQHQTLLSEMTPSPVSTMAASAPNPALLPANNSLPAVAMVTANNGVGGVVTMRGNVGDSS